VESDKCDSVKKKNAEESSSDEKVLVREDSAMIVDHEASPSNGEVPVETKEEEANKAIDSQPNGENLPLLNGVNGLKEEKTVLCEQVIEEILHKSSKLSATNTAAAAVSAVVKSKQYS